MEDAAIVDFANSPVCDPYGPDIFTEPEGDPDTLANLGPLAPLAGVWRGLRGDDRHPVAEGIAHATFIERYELQPIDRQTNGPQLFYGLRYHTHIVQPGDVETFHDQVGYWLWEPAAETVTLTLGVPRGQVLLAAGPASAAATEFEVTAAAGAEVYGILSNPFLDRNFRMLDYRIRVSVHPDGTWSYDEEGLMAIAGREAPFTHRERNTLTKVGAPTPNPLVRAARGDGSLGIGDLRREEQRQP